MPNIKKNKLGLSVAGAAAATIGGIALYVWFHTPNQVTNPSYRTFYRADGIPKKVFDKSMEGQLAGSEAVGSAWRGVP